jgi:hypothetical protein
MYLKKTGGQDVRSAQLELFGQVKKSIRHFCFFSLFLFSFFSFLDFSDSYDRARVGGNDGRTRSIFFFFFSFSSARISVVVREREGRLDLCRAGAL